MSIFFLSDQPDLLKPKVLDVETYYLISELEGISNSTNNTHAFFVDVALGNFS